MNKTTKGALEGVTVLDLTRFLTGPICTMMLADMGADVIKIENPDGGDDSRAFGPHVNGESAYYMTVNRNKKGITLNLKNQDAKSAFLKMVEKADIVVENFRPGVMDRLGLSYEVLKKVNPKIIVGSISGFGQSGPYAERPAFDIIAQAMSGLMSTTGWPDGPPTRVGTPLGDVLGGYSMAIALLGALHHQRATGEGQYIDIALVDSAIVALQVIIPTWLQGNEIPGRIGNRYISAYPYDTFKSADGDVIIGCANQKFYEILCDVMERKDLVENPKYTDIVERNEHHAELKAEIEKWSSLHTSKEISDALLKAGCPSAPILNIKQVTEDEHIAKYRNMFVDIEHPIAGKVKVTNSNFKMSETKCEARTPSPTLGQHNQEILKEFCGLSDEQIAEMKEKHAI